MSTHHIESHTKTKTSSPQQSHPRTRPPAPAHSAAIIQRARAAPESLRAANVLQLQHTIGNRAVGQLLAGIGRLPSTTPQSPVQRQEILEEEELLQGKMIETVQRQGPEEEEELMQGKTGDTVQRQGPEEEELLQGQFTGECVQCQAPEEEELMQGKFAWGLTGTLQAKEEAPPNRTGMPDHLKSGIENISGMDLSRVRVHYRSSKPAQLNTLAYTQGQEIHVAPGQEKHLPHEGWHAVQQMQGRVRPTIQARGVAINDDVGLEREADIMGGKALIAHESTHVVQQNGGVVLWPTKERVESVQPIQTIGSEVVQRRVALAKESEGTPDFVELTSIDYAVKEAGGPVELLKNSDLSKMGEKNVLFIVGHGAPGKISAGDGNWYTADNIVKMLFDRDAKGLQGPIKAIRFTSCYAGAEETAGDATTSIVAKITSKLDEKKWDGVQVSGARGPSIKSAALGKDFTVVPPRGTPEYTMVGDIQKALEKIHEPRKITKDAIKEEETRLGRALTLEEKAATAAQKTADFYKEFVQSLKDPKKAATALRAQGPLTKDQNDLLLLLKKAPGPLTLDPPMLELVSKKRGWCFITTACVEAKGLPDDCYELETLRAFRDGYIRAMPNGEALIAEYYEIAPKIVARIKAQPNAQEILSGLYEEVVKSVKSIEANNYEQALQNYSAIVLKLREKYLHGA
jgi:hypothetical protein